MQRAGQDDRPGRVADDDDPDDQHRDEVGAGAVETRECTDPTRPTTRPSALRVLTR